MITLSFRTRAAGFLALIILLAGPAHLLAQQSQRAGSATRGATRATTTTGTARTGTTGGSPSGPRQYRSNTMLGDAIIQIDPESRSLVVITDEETHEELEKVIKNLDRPRPQVLIKVLFVEVTYNKDYDVGVEATLSFGDERPGTATNNTITRTTTDGGTESVSTTTSATTEAALRGLATVESLLGVAEQLDGGFVRFTDANWSATLRALARNGKTEVLSRPSIMARNNQEAVIVVGEEVPFITNSRITDNGQTINTIQYENVGIILKVTPFITAEGTVEMIVAPEISTLTDRTVPISNTVSSPVIAKRSAETVVVTPNAKTIVIGGLMETQKMSSVRKVPLLGDIPGLGMLFRRTIKEDVKRELLIFLTPYIVTDARGMAAVTQDEVNRTTVTRRAFTPEEFDVYLDNPLFEPEGEPMFRESNVKERKPRDPFPEQQAAKTKRVSAPVPTPAPEPKKQSAPRPALPHVKR